MIRKLKHDFTGQRFGKLVALSFKSKGEKTSVWICRCDCGNLVEVQTHRLNGTPRQCKDCWNTKLTRHGFRSRNGHIGSAFYEIWRTLVRRTTRKSARGYAAYGGAGIGICESWLKFENFKVDMFAGYLDHQMEHGKDTSIDRINNRLGYSKENCRWATRLQQNNNKSDNVYMTAAWGETKTLAEWAREFDIPYGRLISRLARGWGLESALILPARAVYGYGHGRVDKIS